MLSYIKTSPFLILLLSGLLLTVGDIIFKKWILTPTWTLYAFGIAIWLIALNGLAYSFKFQNIATASLVLVLFNIISLALVSLIYFKEPLSSRELLGIVMGLAAVALLELD
jgi:multidrug transporter EmrE-like cation transporter